MFNDRRILVFVRSWTFILDWWRSHPEPQTTRIPQEFELFGVLNSYFKLNKTANDASSQIDEKKYAQKYLCSAETKGQVIHELGINFSYSREIRNITDWKENIVSWSRKAAFLFVLILFFAKICVIIYLMKKRGVINATDDYSKIADFS